MTALEIVGMEWLGALALFLSFILLVRYLDHRERMAMIDRGLISPQEANKEAVRHGSAVLRGGVITAMVGLAVSIGLYTLGYLLPAPFSAVPGRLGPWLLPGLIPLFVGGGLVASHYLAPPTTRDAPAKQDDASDAGDQPDRPAQPTRARRPVDWRLLGSGSTAANPEDDTE
ncbi:MAG TPA: DUF6249 domain-containing protein [Ktedonobacterales bacterium]